ncbi:MAG TPA: hypothetical protein VHV51_22035, partial [Polyangiaceae bacterium]|nr:hypothetical protein [Polyangiaceae bacterium]
MALFRTHAGLLLSAIALNCTAMGCGSSDSSSDQRANSGGSAGAINSAGASGANALAGSSGMSGGSGGSAGSSIGSAGSAGLMMGGSGGMGGASSAGAGGGAPLLVWPNETSFANSDPWLSQHHDEIQEMHPRFLVVNFANNRKLSDVQARFETQKAWMMEGTRYHGYSDPNAKPFLIYELAKLVDLSDPAPSASPYPNSTKMPRRAKNGGNDIDYSQLFNQTYADYYAIPDPNNASHNLTLCELFAKGIVNDIFLVVNKTA